MVHHKNTVVDKMRDKKKHTGTYKNNIKMAEILFYQELH